MSVFVKLTNIYVDMVSLTNYTMVNTLVNLTNSVYERGEKNMQNNIANLRKEKGFSQKDFAKKVGITANWMNHIENGKRKPSVGMLEKIAENLEVTLKDIFLD